MILPMTVSRTTAICAISVVPPGKCANARRLQILKPARQVQSHQQGYHGYWYGMVPMATLLLVRVWLAGRQVGSSPCPMADMLC